MAKKTKHQANCSLCGDNTCYHAGKNLTSYCGNFFKGAVKPPKQAKYRADENHAFASMATFKRALKEHINNKIIEEEKS